MPPVSIDSMGTFCQAISTVQSVLGLVDFGSVFENAATIVKTQYPSATQGAMNNVRGDWYEWLLFIGALEYLNQQAEQPPANIFIPLPNVREFDCATLYIPPIAALVHDLKQKTEASSQVSLVTSNPDFVIVKRADFQVPSITFPVTQSQAATYRDLYKSLVDKCAFDRVVGYASVKLSLRPDRRLQLPHEGSLMKAIYRHIQTRMWITDAPGIKYYAVSAEHSDADLKGLRTVATHSIVTVNAKPEAAVDGLYAVNSGPQLSRFLHDILS